MVNLSWLPPVVAQASERLVSNFSEFAGTATVWLAVTGLSRSGKTVFITSLIHNLLSTLQNPNRMPLLDVVGTRRLVSANLESTKAYRVPRFPYFSNVEKMAGSSPDWPTRTLDISEIGIEIRFTPASTLGKLLSELTGSPAKVTLRIIDYPGEWLLDLPLLEQSFRDWSRATLDIMRQGARAEIGREFFAFMTGHRPDEPASDELPSKRTTSIARFCSRRATNTASPICSPAGFCAEVLLPKRLSFGLRPWSRRGCPCASHARRAHGGAFRGVQA